MIFYKIILCYLFHRGVKRTPESRIAIILYSSIPLPAKRGSHYLCLNNLYQIHYLTVSLRIAIPILTYTSLEKASQHTRKAQALKFQIDPLVTSVTYTFLEILLHADHVQVRGCAKASGEQFPLPVNEFYQSSHHTRNRHVKL